MRISDWSSDVCSSDLRAAGGVDVVQRIRNRHVMDARRGEQAPVVVGQAEDRRAVGRVVAADALEHRRTVVQCVRHDVGGRLGPWLDGAVVPDPFGVLHVGDSRWKRSEEHKSELQSLMRISYAVFCLKKITITNT